MFEEINAIVNDGSLRRRSPKEMWVNFLMQIDGELPHCAVTRLSCALKSRFL